MNGLSMRARIFRLTLLAVIGLIITFAMGITTMGTMIVYCGLLQMYSNTLKGCRALMGKRILLQFVGVPITVVIHNLLLFIPGIPVKLRLILGVAIALPTLLTINQRFKLGFSEVSQHVIVALITMTFESNPVYFAYRLLLTTLGVVIGYIAYKYVFPLRHDIAFEETREALLEALDSLAEKYLESAEKGGAEAGHALALAAEARKHLDVVAEDVDIKRQYAGYKGRTGFLLWEHEAAVCFLSFYAALEEGVAVSPAFRARCIADAEGYWRLFRQSREGLLDSDCGWDKSLLGCVETAEDFRLAVCLERLRSQMQMRGGIIPEKIPA